MDFCFFPFGVPRVSLSMEIKRYKNTIRISYIYVFETWLKSCTFCENIIRGNLSKIKYVKNSLNILDSAYCWKG